MAILKKMTAQGVEPRMAEILRFGLKQGGLEPKPQNIGLLLEDYARDMGLEGGVTHPLMQDFLETLFAARDQPDGDQAIEIMGARLPLIYAHSPQEVQAQYRRLIAMDQDFQEEVEDRGGEEQIAERPDRSESETERLDPRGAGPDLLQLDAETQAQTETLFTQAAGDLASLDSLNQEERRNILRLIQGRWRAEGRRDLTPDERAVFDALVTSVPDDPLYDAAQEPRLEQLNALIEGNPQIIEIGQNWDQWLFEARSRGRMEPVEQALATLVNIVGQVYGFEAPNLEVTFDPPEGYDLRGRHRSENGESTISIYLNNFPGDFGLDDFVWTAAEEAFHHFQYLQREALRRGAPLLDEAYRQRAEDWYLNAGLNTIPQAGDSRLVQDVYENQVIEADAKEVANHVAGYVLMTLGMIVGHRVPRDPRELERRR